MAGEPPPAPLVRTRRSTTQPAELRLPSASPTNRPLTGPRAQEPSGKRKQREHGPPGDRGEPCVQSALYSTGLCPSLHPVLGSTSLRGILRSLSKGGVPSLRSPHAVHPPIGSELPRPFPSHQPRRNRRANSGRKNRAPSAILLYLLAFSDGFRRGNRRSVVRRGWRSQAGVVAKMVVVVVMVICCVAGVVAYLVAVVVCVEVCCNGGSK